MKRDWLLYLVIFSLALNVGTIGTFAYLRWKDRQWAPPPPHSAPMPFRKLMGKLQLDRQQRRVLWGMLRSTAARFGSIGGNWPSGAGNCLAS